MPGSNASEQIVPAEQERRGIGLSMRLLLLTLLFVMLAEILIYVPAVANFRNNWLRDRLAEARTAALVLDAAPPDMIPEGLVAQLLNNVGAKAIALKIRDTRRLLALSDMPPMSKKLYDLREEPDWRAIPETLDTVLNGEDRIVRAMGPAPMGGQFVEIVFDETPLRQAILKFSRELLLISLLISAITAALVYFSLRVLIVRPVQRLTGSIMRFAARPEDGTRIIRPSGRSDEIGMAERELASMQTILVQQLAQRERLAQLGLAVSKINHDLRNLLASAQLMSDQLARIAEPSVQRFAPKLIGALDRAIAFCESTLAFGQAKEKPPQPKPIVLARLVEEVRDLLPLGESIAWQSDIPEGLKATVDPDYLFRVLLNLSRNAVQALGATPAQDGHHIRISGRIENGALCMRIADSGPGIPQAARGRLFEAFQSSNRKGGSGLGLAISADLIRAHGGSLRLIESERGACFELVLPQEP